MSGMCGLCWLCDGGCLFGEQLEDGHVVLAERLVGLAGIHDVGDEARPVVRPLLLDDL